jgi:methionyl-tRNA formyltransferase
MRFAMTVCDRYLSVFEAFLAAGWEPVKLFSVPATNALDANDRAAALAKQRGIDMQLTRMSQTDLRDLEQRGCDALIVASYNWRIGDWRPHLKYAVNFHPSPLPLARGPYPMVRAILEDRRSWGVTCHKLEAEFDSGDMLAAEPFALHAEECHESLNLKLQMACGRLAARVAHNFESLWRDAEPQGPGEYWPIFTMAQRTVQFSDPVSAILRQLRAFGSLECYGVLNNQQIFIRRAVGWNETHDRTPGSLVHINNRTLVMAARDGYIALLEWGPIVPPSQVAIQNPPAN